MFLWFEVRLSYKNNFILLYLLENIRSLVGVMQKWLAENDYLSSVDKLKVSRAIELTTDVNTSIKNDYGCQLSQQVSDMLVVMAAIKPDMELVCASVIYPFVHYGNLSTDKVVQVLGVKIAALVSGVIKISAIGQFVQYKTAIINSTDNFEQLRKMMLAMVNDPRIIIIKIAEQINFFSYAKDDINLCKKLAAESSAVYAPLANRLGVSDLKWQLEDLSFRYSNPEYYKEIASELASKRKVREIYAAEFMVQLRGILEDCAINAIAVNSRVKHIYSIYLKMRRKNKTIQEIYDQIAVRVIVADVAKCYSALSTIHAVYSAVSGEFDDYIASPKANGYKSIHTAVYGPENKIVEIQIRTQAMHDFAEYGVASHWLYKESNSNSSLKNQEVWLDNLAGWQQHANVGSIGEGLFTNEVFAFTPAGDVKGLAKGATVLDFAYAIHTQVGHGCSGAKINDKIVPLGTKIKNGNIIAILTNKNGSPSRDWLDERKGFLATSRARAKVQQWFRAQDFTTDATTGRAILEKEIKKLHVSQQINLQRLTAASPYDSLEQLFAALGRAEYSTAATLKLLQEPDKSINSNDSNQDKYKLTNRSSGTTLSHVSLCCRPVPGDDIIGYVTIGRGITIHKIDCSNIKHLGDDERQRLIEVDWSSNYVSKYPVSLHITANNSPHAVSDINKFLLKNNISLLNLNCHIVKDVSSVVIDITIELKCSDEITKIMNNLISLPQVKAVEKL